MAFTYALRIGLERLWVKEEKTEKEEEEKKERGGRRVKNAHNKAFILAVGDFALQS